jgi:hypothetical protein
MDSKTTEQRNFIPYPTNRVVEANNARAATEALLQAGFARDDIDVLHGDDDVHRLDPTGADIAVVHARMTLSGQTPVDAIERPRSRTNIFSFVVRRTAIGGSCAAAPTTDVITQMETNVVAGAGMSSIEQMRFA